MTSATILSQSYGYGFVVGLGAAFAIVMCGITYVLAKYLNQVQNSERFTTASRNVGSGLISSAVVSSWVSAIVNIDTVLLTNTMKRFGLQLS